MDHTSLHGYSIDFSLSYPTNKSLLWSLDHLIQSGEAKLWVINYELWVSSRGTMNYALWIKLSALDNYALWTMHYELNLFLRVFRCLPYCLRLRCLLSSPLHYGNGVGIYSITISRLSVSILFYSRSARRASTACAMDVNERILHLQIYK